MMRLRRSLIPVCRRVAVTMAIAVTSAITAPTHARAEVSNIAVWGTNTWGELDAPAGADYVSVAAGYNHGLALTSDGSIRAWGGNLQGQATPPAGSGYQSIAAGNMFSLALTADRSIAAWGYNFSGEAVPPAGTGYLAIAAGSGIGVALASDHSLIGWGDDSLGGASPPPGNDYTDIAAGDEFGLALKSDHSIVGWGWDAWGKASPPPGNDYVAVAAGDCFAAALRSDGSITAWGCDVAGRTSPPPGNDFVDISTAQGRGLALRSDGSIAGWGEPSVPDGNGFTAIAAGGTFAAALTDGVLTEPRSVTAVPGHGEATVSWLAPLSDAGSPITSYNVVSSPDSKTCGTTGSLSSCTVENLRNGIAYTFKVQAVNDIRPGPWSTPTSAVTPTADPFGEFTPLAPARILDTRTGVGRAGVVGPIRANTPIEVQVTGRGGVASTGVIAVVMNVTVTQPTAWSYLTVWPSDVPQPDSSNLNYVAGQTVPNHVTVAVSDIGRVKVVNRFGTAHVIFDVVGFYADDPGPAGSRYHSVDPSRLFDTRSGLGGVPVAPLGAAKTLPFDVLGKGGVPSSGVTAVVMNVTVARATEWSYLTVFPGDLTTPPLASNLNYLPGQAVPNLVTVRVPASGVVNFYNQFGTVHVIADVVGYFDENRTTEAGRFIPLDPYRIFDSRDDGEKLGPNSAWLIGQFPGFGFPLGEAEAVVLNVTVTGPTAWSYLSVFPSHLCELPDVSNLNYVAGQTVPNQVVTRLATASDCAAPEEIETIAVYNYDGSTHVIIDGFGLYTAATTTLGE